MGTISFPQNSMLLLSEIQHTGVVLLLALLCPKTRGLQLQVVG